MVDNTIVYVARPGDYLVKIAEEHGTTWQAIWNHPLNAEHRRKRKSPDKLKVGDVLHVPSAAPVPAPTPAEWPRALNTPFTLEVGRGRLYDDTTDDQGRLEFGDVDPGDYALRIGEVRLHVPAIRKSERHRPILALDD